MTLTGTPGGVLFSELGTRIDDVYIREDGYAADSEDRWANWFIIRSNLSIADINRRDPKTGIVYFKNQHQALRWAKGILRVQVKW